MKKQFTAISAGIMMVLAATPVLALSVDADLGASANVNGAASAKVEAKLQTRIATAKDRAIREIDRRIKALEALAARVSAMVRVSASEKTAINADVQNQTSLLASLKAKIQADTDIETLKADIKSITASYRIFMLIIPQGRIEVAADKVHTVASNMTTFSGKLSTRIANAKTAGKDTASLEAALSDMNAKIADANAEASAAASAVASLTPDNGDKAKRDANHKALVDARAKIKVALEDLKTARKDAKAVVEGLASFHLDASASASGSASVQ